MLTLLRRHFGYDTFRPLQAEIISHVLGGGDALVLMPTGGGKSLTFQLPALQLPGLTLVVSPLIALMKDQVDTLRESGIAAEFLNSTLSTAEALKIETATRAGKIKLLYVAPERIATASFQTLLKDLNVSLIAIDEAHCISEWGHDFRPDYRNLKLLRASFPHVPVIALTATATPRVQTDILTQLQMPEARVFVSSFNRPNLTYAVRPKKNFLAQLLELIAKHPKAPAIVYCFSRADTEELAANLNEHGISALPYHAGLSAVARTFAQEKFIRDEVPVICATIAFGMGIDKPDIRLVVHADLPKSVEGYYQETGRAGRDDLPAECVLFFSYGDRRKQDFFINQISDAAERERAETKLAMILAYGELVSCRRQFLLNYFGEQLPTENCGGCDVCLNSSEEVDATILAQKVLSCIVRTGERFGAAHIISILTGESSTRVRQLGHERLPTFGAARETSAEELQHAIKYLVARGLLTRAEGKYPTLALTPRGKTFLNERAKISLPKFTAEIFASRHSTTELEPNQELFDRLRALRKRIADERGVPPFVIFGDRTLIELAHFLPQSAESLRKISGVGEHKLATLGEQFLAVIHEFAREKNLAERPKFATIRSRPRLGHDRHASNYLETKKLVLQKLPLAEIAKRRGFTPDTIVNHLEKLLASGEVLDLAYLRPHEKEFTEIAEAFRTLETEALGSVRERLGEKYGYDQLKLVRLFLKQGEKE